eukprot:GCRY01004316.1.p1 GENE.GCRY01004316.1~~GCRY01004316.1.p1  ORF type:complete len:139 (+),score=25.34 GCRY01004316.1:249-665(+)
MYTRPSVIPEAHKNSAFLSNKYKTHQGKVAASKQENEKLRVLTAAAATQCSHALLDTVNENVSQLFANQKNIDAELKALQGAAAAFSKKTQNWIKTTDSLHSALKELGDVENWGKTMEWDLKAISSALDALEAKAGKT